MTPFVIKLSPVVAHPERPEAALPPAACLRRATLPEPSSQQSARLRRGSDGGRPPVFDAVRYKKRNVAERAINKLRAVCAVGTRYDERAFVVKST